MSVSVSVCVCVCSGVHLRMCSVQVRVNAMFLRSLKGASCPPEKIIILVNETSRFIFLSVRDGLRIITLTVKFLSRLPRDNVAE